MQCQKCGRIKKFAFTESPHFWCYVCEPRAGESSLISTVLLWVGVLILIVGAWTLLG
jgi:hypothetical protein